MMQYYTVKPLSATAGSPPGSTQAQAMVKGHDDAETYVENLLTLLRTGASEGDTARRGLTMAEGWTLLYAGGVGDDEDYWIADCEGYEATYPGLHARLGVEITFTEGPYGLKAGVVR
jgi:hypothetical protein